MKLVAATLMVAVIGGTATESVRGAQTRTAETSATELQRGEADGMAVTSRGRLLLAPRLSPFGAAFPGGGAAHIWCLASDRAGNVYLGTGPDGRVVKVTPAGQQSVFFTASEPMVTALTVLPGGDMLAGTAPEGHIYRIKPDGKGTLWSELDARYVWSLAVADDGTVLAGTGEQGVIYRLDKLGKPTALFDSEDSHIVALVPLRDGSLLAGGSGRGLVYRINREGHAEVLYDDELPEAHAIVAEADGSVLAAFVNAPEPERRPPAVRIEIAGGSQVGETVGADDRTAPRMQGVIEGLPEYDGDSGTRVRGRIVRIRGDGAVSELWRSATEAPFSLTLDREGRPIFGTGEPARLFRIEPGGEVALMASLREGQVTGMFPTTSAIVVATSNPAATYSLAHTTPESGTFLSRPVDAGGTAKWGTLRWTVEGLSRQVEVYSRTGNAVDPDETWSAWSPALHEPSGTAIPNPPGRFLQWRVRLMADAGLRVGAAWATYVTENREPQIRDLRLDPAARAVSGKLTFKWSALDPDGDPVAIEVQYRANAEAAWVVGARSEPPAIKPGEPIIEQEPSWRDGKAVWDTTEIPEGTYQVRIVGSDRTSNPEGAGRETSVAWPSPVLLDRTPPDLAAHKTSGDGVEVEVSDATSPILRLEVVAEGQVLFAARPLDGVADALRERYRLTAAEAGAAGTRTLRAVDAAGNVVEAPVPSP